MRGKIMAMASAAALGTASAQMQGLGVDLPADRPAAGRVPRARL